MTEPKPQFLLENPIFFIKMCLFIANKQHVFRTNAPSACENDKFANLDYLLGILRFEIQYVGRVLKPSDILQTKTIVRNDKLSEREGTDWYFLPAGFLGFFVQAPLYVKTDTDGRQNFRVWGLPENRELTFYSTNDRMVTDILYIEAIKWRFIWKIGGIDSDNARLLPLWEKYAVEAMQNYRTDIKARESRSNDKAAMALRGL